MAAVIQALAVYAGDESWDSSIHLRVLAREIAMWAVVTACVDGFVMAEGVIRPDGSTQRVLDRRGEWGARLVKNIAQFEELVQTLTGKTAHPDHLLAQLQAEAGVSVPAASPDARPAPSGGPTARPGATRERIHD